MRVLHFSLTENKKRLFSTMLRLKKDLNHHDKNITLEL